MSIFFVDERLKGDTRVHGINIKKITQCSRRIVKLQFTIPNLRNNLCLPFNRDKNELKLKLF